MSACSGSSTDVQVPKLLFLLQHWLGLGYSWWQWLLEHSWWQWLLFLVAVVAKHSWWQWLLDAGSGC